MSARPVAVAQGAVLRGRVQDVLEQLHHVEQALRHPALDARLRGRMAVRFEVAIRQRREVALRLRQELEKGLALEDGWEELHDLHATCAPLFAESLAFVHGALARAIELDSGVCRIADALLEELGRLSERPWERFTVLAQGESFHDLAAIIRLRFPDVSVWSLPVAAHEFGHYVARALEDSPDLALSGPFKRARALGEQPWLHAHEQFADCYATYALGPAYPAMCVVQRFDPHTAGASTHEHPSAAGRVALCLGMLERMDRDAGLLTPFATIASALRDTWDALVADATGRAGEAVDAAHDATAERFWTLLEGAAPAVRYTGWPHAEQIARSLLRQHERGTGLEAAAGDLRDMINAAWLARLVGPAGIEADLGEWSMRTGQALVLGDAPGGGGS